MAYAAPTDETVVILGGLGTQADKAELNGGGAIKSAWDAGSPSDFIGTNGGPIVADTGVAYDHTGGTVERMLSKAGIGTSVIVGTLVYVSGTNITAGIYEITTVAGDGSYIACADIDATGDNADSVVNIGGALDTLQNTLDNSVNDAALQNRYIYDNIATETISATIVADTNGGTTTTSLYIIGYNSTLIAEAQITITTGTDLTTNALFEFITVDYYVIGNIDFNCGGKDSNLGGYSVYAAGAGDGASTLFYNCQFRGAEIDGVLARSANVVFLDCQFYLNGRYGYNASSSTTPTLINCSVHDNDNHGVNLRTAAGSEISNCLVYDNGKDGTGHGIAFFSTCKDTEIIGNTIYGNASNGIDFVSASERLVVINNTSVGNGGYGYDFNGGGVNVCSYFGYNHSSVNVTAHTDAVADGSFAAFKNGNNKADTTAAADIFTSVTDGAEDFTPKTATALIDSALDAGTA